MVESCCIQQIFIELPEIAGIESSDFLKAEKAVNHKDQPLRIVIYPKTNIPLPTILCYWNFSRLYISKSYSSVSFHPSASVPSYCPVLLLILLASQTSNPLPHLPAPDSFPASQSEGFRCFLFYPPHKRDCKYMILQYNLVFSCRLP